MEPIQDKSPGSGSRPSLAESPAAKDAAAWVQQFARTLKTCRLYDQDNSTAVRFRAQLASDLSQILASESKLVLNFSSTEILCEVGSGSPATASEESLATSFYRDGIRTLIMHQGIEQKELDVLLNLLMRVSGPSADDEDLVTLIWDADLPHVNMSFVAMDADVESDGDADAWEDENGSIAPWPGSDGGTLQLVEAPRETEDSVPEDGGEGTIERSDDWLIPRATGDPEAVYKELEKSHQLEVARFRSGYEAEYKRSGIRTSLELMRDCLQASGGPADTADFRRFLARPLHEALGAGDWSAAAEALDMIRESGDDAGFLNTLVGDLCQPNSLTSRNVVAQLDRQNEEEVGQFLSFSRSLGPVAIEWLMHLLASSEKRDPRLALAATVSDLCRDTPERMTPWLSDSRWYVVRNVIHILGRIGGPRIVDLLRGASEHDEFRVRQEVVSAAAATGAEEARPLLLGMLNTMDTRLFCAALRQLSTRRDPELAAILVAQLQAPGFLERPTDERRAVYVGLAAAGDDETVPALEAELARGSWLTRRPDAHQRAVARCLLHLDTPRAREALAAGCRSRRPAVRKACEDALGGTET